MNCAWQEFLKLIPFSMRKEVDKLASDRLQELRLRIGIAPELIIHNRSIYLKEKTKKDDIAFVINAASKYSPWTASTIKDGYLTAAGGHRIGICGEGILENGLLSGIRTPTSLCIRVARDYPDLVGDKLEVGRSILIIGIPGSGKTTLLRDLIRKRSDNLPGSVAVVDERGELFPCDINGQTWFPQGARTDILRFSRKEQGIMNLLKAMCPDCIAVDEISSQSDCDAILKAGWCGVDLFATAHARNPQDLMRRGIYRPIVESGLFETLLVMQPDKSWKEAALPS